MQSAEFIPHGLGEMPIALDVHPAEKKRINDAFYAGFKKVYEVNPELLPTNPALIVTLDDSDLQLKGKELDDDAVKNTAETRQKAREQKVTRESVLDDREDIRNMLETTPEKKTAKDNAVADEIKRREDFIGAADTIYTATACETAIKDEAVDRVVLAENKKRVGLTPEEEEKFRNDYKTKYSSATAEEIDRAVQGEYEQRAKDRSAALMTKEEEVKFRVDYIAQYTDGKGTYYKLDPVTGKPDKSKPVLMASVYKPIYGEIKRIGADTDNILQYDATHNVFLGTSAEEVRKKELEVRSIELMEIVIDVFDTALMPYGETIPKKRNEKTKKEEIDFEALEKVFPSGRFGRMAILFTTYHELDPLKNGEQRNTLVALLFQELRGVKLDSGNEAHKNLTDRINSLSKGGDVFDAQLNGLTAGMRGLMADALQIDPNTIPPLEGRHILRDLLIAYTCKAHVGLDQEGNIAFDQEAKKLIGRFAGDDRIHKQMEMYLAALTTHGDKIGKLLIDSLGLDAERLQKPLEEGASYYTQQLVAWIQERRTKLKDQNKPQLNPHQEGNYKHMSEEMIKYEALKFMEKNPFANWLKMLGMLALIMGPSASQLLNIGVEEDRGGPQQQ